MGNEATLKLAYDSSVRAIDDQARVLEGLRSRGGTMFAAGALVTSLKLPAPRFPKVRRIESSRYV
jgi:hypothetical protein